MGNQNIEKIVIDTLIKIVSSGAVINSDSSLIGEKRILDSFGLVEFCVSLEENLKNSQIQFDWTSDTAMSKSSSMFKNVKSLCEEIYNQNK